MPQVLTNDLKIMKKKAEKIPGFNDNFFVSGDMLPVCSNTLTNHKNVNCKLADVKQIDYMISDILVHLFWLIKLLMFML